MSNTTFWGPQNSISTPFLHGMDDHFVSLQCFFFISQNLKNGSPSSLQKEGSITITIFVFCSTSRNGKDMGRLCQTIRFGEYLLKWTVNYQDIQIKHFSRFLRVRFRWNKCSHTIIVWLCHVSKLRTTSKSNRFPYSNRTLGYNRMDHPISKKRPCVVTNWKLASWTLEEASDFSHPKTVPWHFCNSVSKSLGKILY